MSGALRAAAMQTLFEEVPELCVEDGVDDGVESAVDVAEPGHHAHQGRRDVAVMTTGSRYVEDKEGSPAQQEGTCRSRTIRADYLQKENMKQESLISIKFRHLYTGV